MPSRQSRTGCSTVLSLRTLRITTSGATVSGTKTSRMTSSICSGGTECCKILRSIRLCTTRCAPSNQASGCLCGRPRSCLWPHRPSPASAPVGRASAFNINPGVTNACPIYCRKALIARHGRVPSVCLSESRECQTPCVLPQTSNINYGVLRPCSPRHLSKPSALGASRTQAHSACIDLHLLAVSEF